MKTLMHNTIKTFLLFTLFALFSIQTTYAQGDTQDGVNAMRAAFIVKKLDLTEDQMQEFLPIYNDCRTSLDGIKKKIKDLESGNDASKILEEKEALIKESTSIKEECQKKYQEIISADKILLIEPAEKSFLKMLLGTIKQKEGTVVK